MSKKIIFITAILIIIFFVLFLRKKTEILVNPAVTPLPSATINPPKEIKYDSSTDLKKELDSVDPQVLDEDFN